MVLEPGMVIMSVGDAPGLFEGISIEGLIKGLATKGDMICLDRKIDWESRYPHPFILFLF